MKTRLLSAVFLCVSFVFSLQARNLESIGSLGLTFSGFGGNTAYHFGVSDERGNYNGNGFFSIGVTYLRPIFEDMDIEFGVEFGRFNYLYNPVRSLDGRQNVGLSLITIPLTVRYYFWQFFFVNGGLLLDFDITRNNHLTPQSGLGLSGGVGFHYDFSSLPVGIFVNPFARHHSLLLFSRDGHNTRTMEAGIRIGLVYNFGFE